MMTRELNNIFLTEPDNALLQLIQQGKKGAFDVLYERYSQRIFSYFFRMLWKNKVLAEDLTQELFLKIWKHATDFDTQKNFSTWMYSIANNMCKNEYRKHANRSKHLPTQQAELSMPAINLDEKKFREAVQDCTNALSEDKKTLYLLRFQENLTVPEISQILHLPEGTIKSRIFYLLKEMKEKLQPFQQMHVYP
jgi:RNA polymerase sigma-70 factor (ECF subfamily)